MTTCLGIANHSSRSFRKAAARVPTRDGQPSNGEPVGLGSMPNGGMWVLCMIYMSFAEGTLSQATSQEKMERVRKRSWGKKLQQSAKAEAGFRKKEEHKRGRLRIAFFSKLDCTSRRVEQGTDATEACIRCQKNAYAHSPQPRQETIRPQQTLPIC